MQHSTNYARYYYYTVDQVSFAGRDIGPTREIIDKFNSLPVSDGVYILNLSDTMLDQKSAEDLISIFSATPACFSYLMLRNNDFSHLSASDLARVFAALPQTIKVLELWGNGFKSRSIAEIEAIYSPILSRIDIYDDKARIDLFLTKLLWNYHYYAPLVTSRITSAGSWLSSGFGLFKQAHVVERALVPVNTSAEDHSATPGAN